MAMVNFSCESPLTLALVQMEPALGDLPANLDRMLGFIQEASDEGADLIVFPELALTGYHPELLGERLVRLSRSAKDEPIQRLARAAGEHHAWLVFGFIERRAIPGVVYDSIAICSPDGVEIHTYAKTHLSPNESSHYRPGPSLEAIKTHWGMLGVMICTDIGYPEAARVLTLQGANLLIAPSCWTKEDEDIWPVHLQARALDNLAFMAGVNRVGAEGKLHFIGRSMLVDPRGQILCGLEGKEDILFATIDLAEVTRARRRAYHWTGRRPELYHPIADMNCN
jgi:predicted amidohydrolase